jgi:hypothetical protein
MPSRQTEWMTAISDIADELGYGIVSLGPSKVVLAAFRGKKGVDITIESVFLNGALLRELLVPIPSVPTREGA